MTVSATTTRPESWSRREARRVFERLDAPTATDLVGRWDGVLVGRPALRRMSAAIATPTPLRGWCGKEIQESGAVQNLVRRRGVVHRSVRAVAIDGESVLDGHRAVIVDYSMTARRPLSLLRGELRWLTPNVEAMGMLMGRIAGRTIGPFPFVLRRSDSPD